MESTTADLRQRALAAVRDYGIQLTHFRSAVNQAAGLNPTDMECMRLLFQQGVATPSQLARHTGLTSGATTAMLDRLEKAGLLMRGPNPDDRRGTLITAAPMAAEKAASWFESARNAQQELIARYSEQELAIIADVFERFTMLWNEERKKLQGATIAPEL
jgi:DNA-binding MarR family transcriptional regulator